VTVALPILAAPIPEIARILGLGETTTKRLIGEGALETIAVGHRRLVLYASAERYIASLRGQPTDPRRNTAVPKAGARRKAGAAP
jgi:hypothetical protein